MKVMKRVFASLIAVLILVGMMAGSALPVAAATVAGDVNGDGTVNLLDAMVALHILSGKSYSGTKNMHGLFTDGDGVATMADAVLILRSAAGWDVEMVAPPAGLTIQNPTVACPNYYYGLDLKIFNQNIRHSSDVYNYTDTGDPYYSYTTEARIERMRTIMKNTYLKSGVDVVGLQEYRHATWYAAWEGQNYATNRVALNANEFGTAYSVQTTSDSILGSGYTGYIQMRDDPTRDSVNDAITWYNQYKSKYEANPTTFDRLQYAYQPEECLAIFWKTSKFTLQDQGVFWISDGYEMFAPAPGNESANFPVETVTSASGTYWQNNHNRLCIWVKLKDKDTGVSFYYASTHLYSSDDQYSIPAADLVMDGMENVVNTNGKAPLMISGDFNLPDTCTAYQNLAAYYNDVAVEMRAAEKTFSAYTRVWEGKTTQSLTKRIDYLFSKDYAGKTDTLSFKLVKDTANGSYTHPDTGKVYTYNDVVSDHRGIYANILVNN